MTASGYLPRRRFSLLGLGLIAASAPFAWLGWESIKLKREQAEAEDHTVDEASSDQIVHIANTVLLYGAKDHATRIRLRVGSLGMEASFEVGGEWRHYMRMPFYIWQDFKTHLRLVTDNWERPVQFKIGEEGFSFSVRVERDYPHEGLLWTCEEVAFSPQELAQLVRLKSDV